jgi:hypothetical protein
LALDCGNAGIAGDKPSARPNAKQTPRTIGIRERLCGLNIEATILQDSDRPRPGNRKGLDFNDTAALDLCS